MNKTDKPFADKIKPRSKKPEKQSNAPELPEAVIVPFKTGEGKDEAIFVQGPLADGFTIENLSKVKVHIPENADQGKLKEWAIGKIREAGIIDPDVIIKAYEDGAFGKPEDSSPSSQVAQTAEKNSAEKTDAKPRKKSGMLATAALAAGLVAGVAGSASPASPPPSVSISHAAADKRAQAPNKRAAFTLVEVLVVMAIIGVLVGLVLPAVQGARGAARNMQRSNLMKQMGIAMLNHESTFGSLPQSSVMENGIEISGIVSLLPYMEQQPAYNAYNRSVAWNGQEPGLLKQALPQLGFSNEEGSLGISLIRNANPDYFAATDPDSDGFWDKNAVKNDYSTKHVRLPSQSTSTPYWEPARTLAGIVKGTSNTLMGAQKADGKYGDNGMWADANTDANYPIVTPPGVKKDYMVRNYLDPNMGNGSVGISPIGTSLSDSSDDNDNAIAAFLRPNTDTSKIHFLFADGHVKSVPYDRFRKETPAAYILQQMANTANPNSPAGEVGLER